MGIEDISEKFDIFKTIKLNLDSSIKDKRKINEENKNKKALIELKDAPDKYLLGIIKPKNSIFFGLNSIENKEKYPYSEIIKYEELSKIMICRG